MFGSDVAGNSCCWLADDEQDRIAQGGLRLVLCQ